MSFITSYTSQIVGCYAKNNCNYCFLDRTHDLKEAKIVFIFNNPLSEYHEKLIFDCVNEFLDEEDYQLLYMVNAKYPIDLDHTNTFLKCAKIHLFNQLDIVKPILICAMSSIVYKFIANKQIYPKSNKAIKLNSNRYLIGLPSIESLTAPKISKHKAYNANLVELMIVIQTFVAVINDINKPKNEVKIKML